MLKILYACQNKGGFTIYGLKIPFFNTKYPYIGL